MKKTLLLLTCLLTALALAACGTADNSADQPTTDPQSTTAPQTTEAEVTEPPYELELGTIYYVGPTRENTSLTQLFKQLRRDKTKKTIYLDPGVYDIFKEYKEAYVATPPDTVASSDYFAYNVFLPPNTNLIGLGDVRLEFAPSADEITYGQSVTWSPLNVLGECYVENIEIYCKNGRYCLHDDSHNDYKNTTHYYKNVRCIYENGDFKDGQQLGRKHAVGNGMAQGSRFIFEDCKFQVIGGTTNAAFYTHESGSSNPQNAPTLRFTNCEFLSADNNYQTIRLQNLATADLRVVTTIENCRIQGGIYLTIYSGTSAQHFDVTLINSGNPPQTIDSPATNRYPIKVQ